MIQRDLQTGATQSFVMTIVADSAFMKRNDAHKRLSNVRFNSVDKVFSGRVYYSLPNGRFIVGYIYEKGKHTANLYRPGSRQGSTVKSTTYQECDFEEYGFCADYCDDPELNCGCDYFVSGWNWICHDVGNPDPCPSGNFCLCYSVGCYNDPCNDPNYDPCYCYGDCGSGGIDPDDCAGVSGGNAYVDACGNCVGGTTGQQPCAIDCNGVPGGSAHVDYCGNCAGGNTGQEPCTNPCTKLNDKDSDFRDKLADLKAKTNSMTMETAYLRTPNGNYSEFVGTEQGYVNWNTSNPITEISHNHNTGLLPIYSIQDLQSLYELWGNGKMVNNNTADFNFVLVAPDAAYDLKITDGKAFLTNFVYKYLKTLPQGTEKQGGITDAQDDLNIYKGTSAATAEKRFLKFIADKGLTLYKSRNNSYTDWGQVQKQGNNINIVNCN